MKKILSLVLALAVALCMTAALAEEDTALEEAAEEIVGAVEEAAEEIVEAEEEAAEELGEEEEADVSLMSYEDYALAEIDAPKTALISPMRWPAPRKTLPSSFPARKLP